jgi:hypothetical protein
MAFNSLIPVTGRSKQVHYLDRQQIVAVLPREGTPTISEVYLKKHSTPVLIDLEPEELYLQIQQIVMPQRKFPL